MRFRFAIHCSVRQLKKLEGSGSYMAFYEALLTSLNAIVAR
jgi:hypothetical protein